MRIIRCFAVIALAAATSHAAEYFMYVGTYTGQKSQGIYVYNFDSSTGKVTDLGLAAETQSPSFLAIHPNRRYLYAVSEINNFDGKKTGAVAAFSIDPATGKLTLLNKVSSQGAGPCYVQVDHTGKNVFVANYSGGSVASLPIKPDGSLGEATSAIQHSGPVADAKRQGGPRAHSINPSPDNRFVLAADLGLDQLLVYRFDPAKGSLEPNDPPFGKLAPRAGPRHFTFDPKGRFVYAINEIDSTITAFAYDAKRGALSQVQTVSTLPKDFSGQNSTAEIVIHPSGRFVYGSNRGHNSIAVFAVDQKKGTLTPIEQTPTQGELPRNFNVDPTGSYLFAANQRTDNITIFRIDKKTGRLTPTGDTIQVGTPVCIKFLAKK